MTSSLSCADRPRQSKYRSSRSRNSSNNPTTSSAGDEIDACSNSASRSGNRKTESDKNGKRQASSYQNCKGGTSAYHGVSGLLRAAQFFQDQQIKAEQDHLKRNIQVTGSGTPTRLLD